MGLRTSPNSFQLLMDRGLHGLLFDSVLCYLDDILVFSPCFTTHLSDLQHVFDRLRKAGLKLGPDKCNFARNNCLFLGHEISSAGIRAPADRILCLQQYPEPTCVSQLRRAMGMFNWFRKFIPNYSSIAKPLTKLLTKGTKYVWTDIHQCAFDELKRLLVVSPVLAFPRYDIPFIVSVDTSSKGIGYMLYQLYPDDVTSDDRKKTLTLYMLFVLSRKH